MDFPAGKVLIKDSSHRRRVQQLVPAQVAFREAVVGIGLQLVFQPIGHRPDETLFTVRDDLRGEETADSLFQQVFLSQPFHFHLRRDGGAELDELVVEERHPNLQGVLHAHPVGDGQDIFGEIGLHIAVKGPVERIGGLGEVGSLEMAPEKVLHGPLPFGEMVAVGEEGIPDSRLQSAQKTEVALVRGQGGGPDEALQVVDRVVSIRPLRQPLHQGADDSIAEQGRHPPKVPAQQQAQVPLIAGEDLVASQAGERDGYILAG